MKELNNNIQESYCSLEVSKLLESKGCTLGENKDGLITHALAIEWIRVNFNIFIHTTCDVGGEFIYTFTIYNVNFGEEQCLYSSRLLYESPQIATDSSLKYVLKELI